MFNEQLGDNMQKGFVTIATGNERYYRMARTLLRSYRQTCSAPVPFAIIADRENEYTAEFDDVVILEHPSNSWMDKLKLLTHCPYDENVFIDADCLIYQDINFFWDLFQNADDFSCFGKALPLDSREGWFTAEAASIYPIQFVTHLHGICYFIRRGENAARMDALCQEIISNYNAVQYKGFNDTLADEPVFALAMAILDLKPIAREPYFYCFVPYATEIKTNYHKKAVTFANPTDGHVDKCCIVHWGNVNTKKALYRFDAKAVNQLESKPFSRIAQKWLWDKELLLVLYRSQDGCSGAFKKASWFFQRAWHKLTFQG